VRNHRSGKIHNVHSVLAAGAKCNENHWSFLTPPRCFWAVKATDPVGKAQTPKGSSVGGIADQADNARSLTNTMPIIATFRATVVPDPGAAPRFWAPFDVNADGKSDVFFRGGTAMAFWGMSGVAKVADAYLGDGGQGYSLIAFGNFDGAGGTDLLWADGSRLKIWFNDGTGRYVVYPIGTYSGGWTPFAAGDVNGDGKSDIIFRGGTALAYWLMDGAAVISAAYAGDGGSGFRVVATADFNNDSATEIVWASDTQIKMGVNQKTAGLAC